MDARPRLRALLSGEIFGIVSKALLFLMFRVKTQSVDSKNKRNSKVYSNTRFHQLLEGLPQNFLHQAVRELDAERYDKSFHVRDHLLALLFGQVSGVHSLRELTTAFNSHAHTHYHLGTHALKRSTLADANHRRNPHVFRLIAERLMGTVHRRQRKQINELLCVLDSTPIPLSGLGFEWTQNTAIQRTQGLKIHLAINEANPTPMYMDITAPNVNDITPAKQMPLEPNTMSVFDKGYCDYNWWHRIDERGSFFVTRFKKHAAIEVIESRTLPEADTDILKDEMVVFKKTGHKNLYRPKTLRCITVHREGKPALMLATNDMVRQASEIAALYKRRWQIELFFKWIKQHLNIKRFLGRSQNAVMLQIYAAIIGYLLVWRYRQRYQPQSDTLHLLLVELRITLFERIATDYHRYRRYWRKEQARLILERQHALPL
jgi:hypothetical protein